MCAMQFLSNYTMRALALTLKLLLSCLRMKKIHFGKRKYQNPVGLLNAVFFYNGKNFCLQGGAEHRNLKISQLKRETTIVDDKEVSCYVYTEFGSKEDLLLLTGNTK